MADDELMPDVTVDTVRVLIVDDQEAFLSAARMVVQLADGFEVIGEAMTGEDAVELAEELRPDLILMDVNLPGIDGLEATRRIKGASGDPVVIVLSTYEASEYEERAIGAGAKAFISKSEFDPERLEREWTSD